MPTFLWEELDFFAKGETRTEKVHPDFSAVQPSPPRVPSNRFSPLKGLRAERANHVWSYEFAEDHTHDGRNYLMLDIFDEFA